MLFTADVTSALVLGGSKASTSLGAYLCETFSQMSPVSLAVMCWTVRPVLASFVVWPASGEIEAHLRVGLEYGAD